MKENEGMVIWGGVTASPSVPVSEGCSVWSVWVGVPSSKRVLRGLGVDLRLRFRRLYSAKMIDDVTRARKRDKNCLANKLV